MPIDLANFYSYFCNPIWQSFFRYTLLKNRFVRIQENEQVFTIGQARVEPKYLELFSTASIITLDYSYPYINTLLKKREIRL